MWMRRETGGLDSIAPRIAARSVGVAPSPSRRLRVSTDIAITDSASLQVQRLSNYLGSIRLMPSCSVTKVTYAYVDARPVRMACVMWPSVIVGDPVHFRGHPLETIANSAAPIFTTAWVTAMDFARPVNNNVAELYAILLCAELADPCQCLAIASDSRVARGWVRKGWATSGLVRTILGRLWAVVATKHLRLLTAWVADPDNLSDRFTRDDPRLGLVTLPWVRPKHGLFEATTWC